MPDLAATSGADHDIGSSAAAAPGGGAAAPGENAAAPGGGAVLLLHGHGRTGRSMQAIAGALEARGHATLAPWYGLRRSMADIVGALAPQLARLAAAHDGPLHIVTHSFGGLVARALLQNQRPPQLGRVVMLAPPHGGSTLADTLHRFRLDTLVLGGAGAFLRTRRTHAAQAQLGAVNFDLGVIAGDRMLVPLLSRRLFDGANDGKVAVAATHIHGMHDHIVLPVPHTLMVHDPQVIAQVLAYLETGAFAR